MYHPLQHKRGSKPRTTGSGGGGGGGGGPARRVSSPDIKLNSLRRTTHQSSQENNTTDSRKKIVRRGSFQGTPRGAGGRGSEVHQGRAHSVTTSPLSPNSHRSTQSLTTGGGGSFQKESLTNSTGSGRCHPTPQLRGGSSTGVSAGTEVHLSNARSQASWSGGTPPDPQLRQRYIRGCLSKQPGTIIVDNCFRAVETEGFPSVLSKIQTL